VELTGIAEIWNLIEEFRIRYTENGALFENRKEQRKYWLHETIREGIFNQVFRNREMFDELKRCEERINRGEMTSFAAANAILNKYKSKHKDS
jgi:LAO/AO transport system kinase